MSPRDSLLYGLCLALPLLSGWFRTRRAQRLDSAESDPERAQEALISAEARFRGVFQATTDGLLVLDERGIVQEANPAAAEMLGFPSARLAGVDVRTLIPADQIGIYDAFRRQLRKTGQVRIDALGVREDGSTFDAEIRGSTLQMGEGRGILVIVTDVTDRKRAEQRLAKLSRTVLMAQEAERERVARDLHDELGQIITALRLELGLLQKRPPDTAEQASEAARGAAELVEKAAAELRRVCQGLRPPLLDDLGMAPAAERLAEHFEDLTGISVDFRPQLLEEDPGITPEIALCTYRILQESLTNVSRHAQATAVAVSLLREAESLHLSVYDNGQGFDPEALSGGGAGITGMTERANLVGGSLTVRSVPQEGTRVTFRAPLPRITSPFTPPTEAAERTGVEES